MEHEAYISGNNIEELESSKKLFIDNIKTSQQRMNISAYTNEIGDMEISVFSTIPNIRILKQIHIQAIKHTLNKLLIELEKDV